MKKAPVSGVSHDTTYTLQVGAFSSLDNASGLQKKLQSRFSNVSILPVTLSDQVFYRVRIGEFLSKAAAETFGNDSLSTAGMTYKAVVK
jgi:cell division septation protein DedD